MIELLIPIAKEAVGHFMQSWKSDAAPMILNPYKYGYTENRTLDLYPDFSEIILDHEASLSYMLNGVELDMETIEDINKRCSLLELQF